MQETIDESALFHQSKSAWCALLDPTSLQLTLRCKANNFQKVTLVSFPRYGAGKVLYPEHEMEPVLHDALYDYYQITIHNIPVKRFAYYFKLKCRGNDTLYCYTEMGLGELQTLRASGKIWPYAFQLPYCNAIDIHQVPEWAKGAVAYQIFPDRFARSSERERQEPNLPAWGNKPTSKIRIGGDLKGIAGRLSYLEKLGVELLYMTPIFQARSNHKYDTTDYKRIDPDFGSNEDFRELVQQCHRRGIRVVLDAVFNHCGPDFAPFVDVRQNGEQSPYKDWFHILRQPIPSPEELWAEMESQANQKNWENQGNPQQESKKGSAAPVDNEEAEIWAMAMDEHGWTTLPYETFAFMPTMPKLNTANPEMREYLLEVAEYWIREYDIDGWRLDVANEVDHQFWRAFRQRVRQAKSDALIVGEIWHDSRPWLQGDQFDCVMNYPFQNISFDFFLQQNIAAQRARQLFNALLLRYSPQVNQVQWNMLDSHDTARLLHSCAGDTAMARLLLGMMLCYIGIPIIYYGTELGLEGAADPDCRRCMPWETLETWEGNAEFENDGKSEWQDSIFGFVQRLIALRKQYAVLRSGSLRWIPTESEDLLAFERFDPSCGASSAERRGCFFNRSTQSIDLSRYRGEIDLLSGKPFSGRLAAKSMLLI